MEIKTLSCDAAKEIIRHASIQEVELLVPRLTPSQLTYALATLPKEKVAVVKKVLFDSSQKV